MTTETKQQLGGIPRALHIESDGQGMSLGDRAAAGLIENALLEFAPDAYASVDQIRAKIKESSDIDYAHGEIRQVLRMLARRPGEQRIVQKGRRTPLFRLTAERRTELWETAEARDDLERRVFEEWAGGIRRKHPDLVKEDVDALLADQRLFNDRVLLRHGAQCVALLYPGQAQQGAGASPPRFEQIIEELPARSDELQRIRRELLVAFWTECREDRAAYLSHLLDKACILHALSVDPACSELIKGAMEGTKLYLDTNVIYRLLNFQGPEHFYQLRSVQEICEQIGIQLLVSQATLRELRASLAANEERIRRYPISSPRLAALAAEAASEATFVSLYFAQYARSRLPVGDFAARVRNVDALLSSLGVAVDTDPHQDILDDPRLREVKGKVYLAAGGRAADLHDDMATHDAYHYLLMARLRRGRDQSFARAGNWFLTCDGKLKRLDRLARGRKGSEVPFCIYPDQLVQCVRWMLPRTDGFDKAFVDLVGSPFVGSFTKVPADLAHRICARIDQYVRDAELGEENAAQLAALTLADGQLAARFRESRNEQDQTTAIDAAVVTAMQVLTERQISSEQALALAQEAALQHRREVVVRDLELESERDARDKAEGAARAAEAKAEAERKRADLAVQAASESDSGRRAAEQRLEQIAQQRRRRNLALRWIACVVGWAALILTLHYAAWPRLPKVAYPTYCACGAIAFPLLLSIPLGHRKAASVLNWAGVVVGLFLGVYLYLEGA